MATGFMLRHSIAVAAALACAQVFAADIALIGTFEAKAAILSIDAGPPKTVRVGQTFGGVTVVLVDKDRATVEIDGKRRVLQRGAHYRSDGDASAGNRQSAMLAADTRGHFIAEGTINGGHIRMLVDTGATTVAIPASEAVRLGIDYRRGQRITMQTANGAAPAYVTRLDRVRVGAIELHNIDAVVVEQGLSIALLGMSFLNRVEMKRDGTSMTLTRQF